MIMVVLMENALSFDLEFWYTAELVRKFTPENKQDQVIEAVNPLLDLLDKYNTKATFFVLGILAEKYPDVVKKIHENGHEIGSHSYSHTMLHKLGKECFELEVQKTNYILKSITGESPIGFRAPTFSIDNNTKWVFEILLKYGYKYDSSIFPIKTNLYGMPDAPVYPYKPSKEDILLNDQNGLLVEFPLSVIKIGTNIPISGGFYLRVCPVHFLKHAIKLANNTRPVVIYMHPWETYPKTQKVPLPFVSYFITYTGINSSLSKLEFLLKNFKFRPLKEILDL
jgi:polysaccharide deacetylase family protein (PEP-CTERM system associated)